VILALAGSGEEQDRSSRAVLARILRPDQRHTWPRSRRYAFASRAFPNSFFRIVRGGEGPVAGEAGFGFGALLPRL
jgi:hypothetical protein